MNKQNKQYHSIYLHYLPYRPINAIQYMSLFCFHVFRVSSGIIVPFQYCMQNYKKDLIYANKSGFFDEKYRIISDFNRRNSGALAPCPGRNQTASDAGAMDKGRAFFNALAEN